MLAKHCYSCHSAKISQGGLRLDYREGLFKGGDGGPVVVPGKPAESRLIQAVSRSGALKMPPSGKLAAREIEALSTWIERGAAYPASPTGGAARGPMSIAEGKRFWAFRPLTRSNPPAVKRASWPKTRIDRYLLAKLESVRMAPSPPAERRTLIRRLSLDLVGLPPSPEEVEAFVQDRSPDAYTKLVERLLASPHYGERWGRHWLDLVRYTDVPEEWAKAEAQPYLYRDWVVRALNDDMPYDRFVRLQLAADEIPGTEPRHLAALGYVGLSPTYWKELKLAPDVIKTVVAEEWEERITMITGSLLGITVGCARCHDHKFDPITTHDYYGLAGILASTRQTARPLLPTDESKAVLAAREQVKALEAEAKRHRDAAAKDKAAAPELLQKAQAAAARAEELRRMPHFDAPTAYAVETASLQVLPDGPDRTKLDYRWGTAQDIPMQVRGNPAKPGEVVPRRYLAVLSAGEAARFTTGSGRKDLADAIFRDSSALAARVMVNRVWRHHFGRGIVETPSNFGVQGDRPTHPELLDDLARRFIEAGWSLKWLHREIVLSAAYQQSSSQPSAISHQPATHPPRSGSATPHSALRTPHSKDPDNRLLGRMERRRLEVEAWRDSILAATGTLDRRIGGTPEELSSTQNVRRTVYGVVKRRELDDLLRLYDFPDPTTHSPARFNTTTPLQQLYVLNSQFFAAQSRALLARLRKEAPAGPDEQAARAHELLYGREIRPAESAAAREFLGEEPSDERWSEYLEVLLARNELMFVE